MSATSTVTETHTIGVFGQCECFPGETTRESSRATRMAHENAWRRHWGWVDATTKGGPAPSHCAPAYVAGWKAARAAGVAR